MLIGQQGHIFIYVVVCVLIFPMLISMCATHRLHQTHLLEITCMTLLCAPSLLGVRLLYPALITTFVVVLLGVFNVAFKIINVCHQTPRIVPLFISENEAVSTYPKTGDIILYRSKTFSSCVKQVALRSPWSHVALIITEDPTEDEALIYGIPSGSKGPYVLDTTMEKVSVKCWADWLSAWAVQGSGACIAWRGLQEKKTGAHGIDISIPKSVPYPTVMGFCLHRIFSPSQRVPPQMHCGQLAMHVLHEHLGIVRDADYNLLPGDFAVGQQIDNLVSPGFRYLPERTIIDVDA